MTKKYALTYYYDAECTKRYPVNEEGHPVIDWGIIKRGQQRTRDIYVRNESRDRAIIRQPFAESPDLSIVDYPTNLFSQDVGKISLKLTPNIESIDAPKTNWGFDYIIG